jgi:hypothetical protein
LTLENRTLCGCLIRLRHLGKSASLFDNPYGFHPGVSGNPAGRLSNKARAERIEAKARELAVEFGGYEQMSPVDRVLLTQAATLLMRRPKNAEDVVRVSNSIARLLLSLQARNPKLGDRAQSSAPNAPSVQELVARMRERP